VAVTADLSKYLDKAYESSSLAEILAAPVSALAGVTEDDAENLRKAFRIKTVGDLGKNKYFLAAQAMLALTK
jgi:threonine aldolase